MFGVVVVVVLGCVDCYWVVEVDWYVRDVFVFM